ncbi:helix-turn-helix domain-containing protein [Crocosphaera sp. XPORK-15E]|uniref:helix-turn-helix domain-containing protein n=1 Tax=Crocosphaera sp. XPORK-15E TaxID=3110247 RepID=UPI002B202E41|nr:helix-turn-helix domain-containing protein [Crocosphaera sp. XPORK-15E]MEA5537348.1 helix-turn-helix domain-containing protein [Crocosphaera sp. XPORK-15E]
MKEKVKESNLPVFEANLENPDLLRLETLLENAHPKLVGVDGEEVFLPESIYQILRQVTSLLAQGKGVTLVPQDHYLTSQEAANLLNISRPYLYTLLDNQEFPYILIGTHRRIKVEDILAYKAKRDRDRRQTLAELIEASQELGFYEAEASDSQEKE